MPSDEDYLQHWLNRPVRKQENQEVANMDATDYAVMLEELEYK